MSGDCSSDVGSSDLAQFRGYYVALEKGYYKEVGLDVNVVSGGGDISETTAVSNGTVDFGVTWLANLIAANAGGMDSCIPY